MKSEEFIDIIGDIEEEYLLKAHEERKIKKVIPMKKVFALVAALIILGATATVAVGISKHLIFTDYVPNNESYEEYESIIKMKVQKEYITEEEIGNDLDGLKEYLREEGYPKNDRRGYRWTFLTQQRAMDVLGCERVVLPDWGEEAIEKGTYLDVEIRNVEDDFEIEKTLIGAEHDIGNISIYSAAEMAFTELGTEYYIRFNYFKGAETKEEYITSKTGAEGIKITGNNVSLKYPVTPLGHKMHLKEETVAVIEAEIIKDKVHYTFRAAAPLGEEEKLEELYEYWLSHY